MASGGTAPVNRYRDRHGCTPGSLKSINHVIFMLQENHTFDDYFGMLNPYRQNNGYNMGDDGTHTTSTALKTRSNGQTYSA